jgi:hypothetical protein
MFPDMEKLKALQIASLLFEQEINSKMKLERNEIETKYKLEVKDLENKLELKDKDTELKLDLQACWYQKQLSAISQRYFADLDFKYINTFCVSNCFLMLYVQSCLGSFFPEYKIAI